jgi:hypothetical protein
MTEGASKPLERRLFLSSGAKDRVGSWEKLASFHVPQFKYV